MCNEVEPVAETDGDKVAVFEVIVDAVKRGELLDDSETPTTVTLPRDDTVEPIDTDEEALTDILLMEVPVVEGLKDRALEAELDVDTD